MAKSEEKKKNGTKNLELFRWQHLYLIAHERNFALKYPTAYQDGHYARCNIPEYKKANGLTTVCINYLNWTGHFAERTNNMGTPTKGKDGVLKWRKGNGTKGTSDIKGHFKIDKYPFPIPIYIEVKIGKDKLSEAQISYKAKVEAGGAKYVIVKDVEDFFNFYDSMKNI